MNKFFTLLSVELRLSLRGMDMFIFAIVMPVVIAFLIGSMYQDSTILAQSFGNLSTISICASGVMGLPLLIADYRDKKILKRFQVTPSSPLLLLSVWVTIYIIYSVTSLVLISFVLVVFFKVSFNGSIIIFLLGYFLVMLSMFSIGLLVGGVAPNIKIASIWASVLYFPMLIFSGATLPFENLPIFIQKAANVLPLTQGVKLLKTLSQEYPNQSSWLPVMILTIVMIVCGGISIKLFKWE
ncbi:MULTISPECIES: ABC transporter permease [Lactobacillales]|uniref:ABC transporter permease n=1 Tax=Lactobacillales TaxID=186826 RepID=UPI001CBB513F|nr:ABC transporter permease [Enterococcus faecium]MBZ3655276.1 ABC transporter permease [Enterococcus faecium]UBL09661.1 Efflux ABC transporter permease protein [Enterococcus faecium]